MNRKPRLLDLFSGAGGCARGYMDAGFYVVGCDIVTQPRYCGDEFYQDDALVVLDLLLSGGVWHDYRLSDFAVIHASPVCKGYSQANNIQKLSGYPMLIEPTRARLRKTGLPWVLENVVMAGKWHGHMPSAVELCGTMFDLKVYRHRYFESSHLLFAPRPCTHPRELLPGYLCVYGNHVRGRQVGRYGNHYKRYSVVDGRAAMGIDWPMAQKELSQSIPPAYTRCVGEQLLSVVLADREVAV